ncbi:orotate phosphoribosyltransferase [candidate division KSB3 bacterium]|uniref:Orotate phosphoribosyltransferase n=1 Tax=candidate division KSB3 bacterium TaxID=2044937 RepID=A0A2G6E2I7_9BACT|nr:MAG: orotate phosphoribosyltransferase [candidate division KSB3 bacterium]PIE28832.1 MAG: orotate phosphoribosyltransferase [candidate division KSB3 bacterium]
MIHEQDIAQILLERQAVTLNATEPYTYASGLRSPIYCDNRRLTFFPDARAIIIQAFVDRIRPLDADVIAGTASSAISWAAWVAAALDLPMVYIRKTAKGYGKHQRIEGGKIRGRHVAVIEDLVSTGSSSLNAVQACRAAGAEVPAMIAIFTYEFAEAQRHFKDADCKALFLSNLSALIRVAAERQSLDPAQRALIQDWSRDPQNWGPAHGFPNAVPTS